MTESRADIPQYEPSDKAKETIAMVKELLHEDEGYRHARYRRFKMLLAYADGRQWAKMGAEDSYAPEAVELETRLPITADYLTPAMEKFVSRQTENPPRADCVARTADEDAIDQAKGAEKIIGNYCEDALKLPEKRQDLWRGLSILGTMFRFVGWDKFAGELLEAKDNKDVKAPSGDPVSDILLPFEAIPSPGSTNVDNLRWFIRLYPKTVDWVQENYPKQGSYVQAEEIEGMTEEGLFGTGAYRTPETDAVGSAQLRPSKNKALDHLNLVMVIEYWEPATKKHRKGRLIVLANMNHTVLLHDGEIPYEDEEGRPEFPFIKYDALPVSGKFWSRSYVEKSISAVRAINALYTDMEEGVDCLKPFLAVMEGSLTRDDTAGMPAHVLPYRRGFNPPQVSPAQPIPPTYFNYKNALVQVLEEIWSWHEPSRGIARSNILSGKLSLTLQQADDRSLASCSRRVEQQEEKHYRMLFNRFRQYTDVERTVRIIGEDNKPEAIAFNGDTFKGVSKVKMVEGSAMPKSREARVEETLQFLQSGLLVDPRTGQPDLYRAIKLMGPGVPTDLLLTYNRAEAQAKREIQEWLDGKARLAVLDQAATLRMGVPVGKGIIGPYDNDEVHLRVHQEFYESTRYEKLDGSMKIEHDYHMAEHEKRILARMTAYRQAALSGQTGTPAPATPVEQAESVAQGPSQ